MIKTAGMYFARFSLLDKFTRSTTLVFNKLQEARQLCFFIEQKEAAWY
jgi:hypothetical protein